MAASSTSAPVPGASGEPLDEDPAVSVARLRQNWAVHEDSALAQRLQSQEIDMHYRGNRARNAQIREVDLPTARSEHNREQKLEEQRRQRQRALEQQDQEMAQSMLRRDREEAHKRYEAARDEAFARRIQRMELEKLQRQRPGAAAADELCSTASDSSSGGSRSNTVVRRPEPEGTPPLPVTQNGDVPAGPAGPQSFQDLQGGIRYNEREYVVKTARPAMVTSEPVYANNRPEHYAVSNATVVDGAAGGGNDEEAPSSSALLSAAGLSQRDLALSRRAEELLEQERRDKELARRLQEALAHDIIAVDDSDKKAEIEAKDLELARALHAKERAKLKRAKERSRLKKLERERQQQQHPHPQQAAIQERELLSQSISPQLPDQELHGRSASRLSRQSQQSSDSHPAEASSSSPPGAIPARKPYINQEMMSGNFEGRDLSEPYYENIPPKPHSRQSSQLVYHHQQQLSAEELEQEQTPVPPYMPMQQSSSRKSSSLEKKILKKKEKEGCKQQ